MRLLSVIGRNIIYTLLLAVLMIKATDPNRCENVRKLLSTPVVLCSESSSLGRFRTGEGTPSKRR